MLIRTLAPWRGRKGQLADLTPVGSNLDELFDRFTRAFDLEPLWTGSTQEGALVPNICIDVREGDKEFTVNAELPGMAEQDIDVSLEDGVLRITGEKKQEKEEKEKDYYRMERSFGKVHREILLPAKLVDESKTEATFKNGVLTISIPKQAEAQHVKKIPVKAE